MLELILALVVPSCAASLPRQDDGRGWRWAELELDVWIEAELGSVHLEVGGRAPDLLQVFVDSRL